LDYFTNNIGLFQGEILSPLLFSLFVNDFETTFIENGATDYDFAEFSLFLLMYADDLVLFSESVDGLQGNLDSKLTVNINKTRIVVFRNGGKVGEDESWIYFNENIEKVDQFCYLGECWIYRNENIEKVDQFCYLGTLLQYNNNFNYVVKPVADHGKGAKHIFPCVQNV